MWHNIIKNKITILLWKSHIGGKSSMSLRAIYVFCERWGRSGWILHAICFLFLYGKHRNLVQWTSHNLSHWNSNVTSWCRNIHGHDGGGWVLILIMIMIRMCYLALGFFFFLFISWPNSFHWIWVWRVIVFIFLGLRSWVQISARTRCKLRTCKIHMWIFNRPRNSAPSVVGLELFFLGRTRGIYK